MDFLKCKVCKGQINIIANERSIVKIVKCTKCGFSNSNETEKKAAEVVIIRRPNRKV